MAVSAPFSRPEITQHVGLQGLHLGQRHRHVVELGRQLVVDHHHHALALHVVEHARAHVLGERIALHGERHSDLVLGLAEIGGVLGSKVDGGRKILVGGGEHGEQVAIALGEQLACGAVPLDHRHLVFLDDRKDCLGQARAVGPKHEFYAVLLHQPLGEFGAARRSRTRRRNSGPRACTVGRRC